jgi:signal transduction histidine kinase
MKERLEMVGGNFSVTSAPGKGTTILAQIPLNGRTSSQKGHR